MADLIREAAERLLQQLELRRTDPDAPLMLEQAESDLRAALAAHPPAPTPEIPEKVRLAFAELERKEQNLRDFRSLRKSLAVDQPPAAEPANDGEREELAAWLEQERGDYGIAAYAETQKRLTRAAVLLRQPAPAPAAVPAPVAERQWERQLGWLTPDGECWWCPKDGPVYWSMANPVMVYDGWLLPHWAIPIPQPPQCGEVAE